MLGTRPSTAVTNLTYSCSEQDLAETVWANGSQELHVLDVDVQALGRKRPRRRCCV